MSLVDTNISGWTAANLYNFVRDILQNNLPAVNPLTKPVLGGTSTQTPGVTAVVSISHKLGYTPTACSVEAGDVNARGAPAMHITFDASNLILNFAGNLAAATPYTWIWMAL